MRFSPAAVEPAALPRLEQIKKPAREQLVSLHRETGLVSGRRHEASKCGAQRLLPVLAFQELDVDWRIRRLRGRGILCEGSAFQHRSGKGCGCPVDDDASPMIMRSK